MIIDIHTHTFPNSDDSVLSIEELIGEAKRVGLDGICVTDHDRFWPNHELEKLSKIHDFLIIPGCELTTDEGHMLVYGLKEYVFGMHRASFVKELISAAGGVSVTTHPYRRIYFEDDDTDSESYDAMLNRASINSMMLSTDAVEVLNSRGSQRENAFAYDVAKRFGKPGTGASDAHRLEDLGKFATEFHCQINGLNDLIREFRSQRFNEIVLDGVSTLYKG